MGERKLLYAFRGWIAFVAFMDLGTAIRSYIEKRSFLGDHSDTQFIEGKSFLFSYSIDLFLWKNFLMKQRQLKLTTCRRIVEVWLVLFVWGSRTNANVWIANFNWKEIDFPIELNFVDFIYMFELRVTAWHYHRVKSTDSISLFVCFGEHIQKLWTFSRFY